MYKVCVVCLMCEVCALYSYVYICVLCGRLCCACALCVLVCVCVWCVWEYMALKRLCLWETVLYTEYANDLEPHLDSSPDSDTFNI